MFLFNFFSLPNPVQLWLHELSTVHEAECTIMLQSKPITSADPNSIKNQSAIGAAEAGSYSMKTQTAIGASEAGGFWAGSSKDTIRAIQSKAHAISAVFVKLCK